MNGNLDQPIAYGRTAEIYAWHNGQVLKLFYDWFGLDDIKYELRIAQEVKTSGLPVPAAGEIIHVNGRNGLTYQRIEGISMLERMSRRPWNCFYYARRMAELHAEMHTSTIQANIPPLHQKLINKITHAEPLSSTHRSKTLALLETMSEGNWLCHGDFHPGNIIISAQGEIIIDWIDASLGNPLADLARTTIISLGAAETNQTQNQFLKFFFRVFHTIYIQRYFSILPGGENEYSRWLPIVAAARLSENIPELEEWLIAQVEKG